MTFETINHLFDRVKEFHRRAGQFYRALGKQVQDDRLQLLFSYLADEECAAADAVDRFQLDAEQKLLQTGYQFAPHELHDGDVLEQAVDENLTLEAACDLIAQVDEVVIGLYRQLAEGTILPTGVNELFGSLAEAQVRQRNRHVRDALLASDM